MHQNFSNNYKFSQNWGLWNKSYGLSKFRPSWSKSTSPPHGTLMDPCHLCHPAWRWCVVTRHPLTQTWLLVWHLPPGHQAPDALCAQCYYHASNVWYPGEMTIGVSIPWGFTSTLYYLSKPDAQSSMHRPTRYQDTEISTPKETNSNHFALTTPGP